MKRKLGRRFPEDLWCAGRSADPRDGPRRTSLYEMTTRTQR